jgi:hypothetical protein
LPEVIGSDHCPVVLEIGDFEVKDSNACFKSSSLCTETWKEYHIPRKTLDSFFAKRSVQDEDKVPKKIKICTEIKQTVKPQLTLKKDWEKIFQKPLTPLCSGHNEPSQEFSVGKKGPNKGRRFYACARPIGNGKEFRCSFFK